MVRHKGSFMSMLFRYYWLPLCDPLSIVAISNLFFRLRQSHHKHRGTIETKAGKAQQ